MFISYHIIIADKMLFESVTEFYSFSEQPFCEMSLIVYYIGLLPQFKEHNADARCALSIVPLVRKWRHL